MKRALAIAVLSHSFVAGTTAAAPSRLTLAESDCPTLDGTALRELVELELRTLSLTDTAAQVRIACSGDTATVSLEDARGRAFPIESRIDFSRAGPGARERLVALAATELVAQAERAAAAQDRDAAHPAENTKGDASGAAKDANAPDTSGGTPTATPADGSRTEISLGAVVTVTGTPTTVLAGGALGARVTLTGPWAVALDARLERGAVDIDSAHVIWTLFGGSAALMLGKRFGIARGDLGAGVRVAHLTLDADASPPDRGREVSGAWLGPLACASAAVDLATHVALVMRLEGGYVTLPVRGTVDGTSVVDADGLWGSLGVGVAAF